MEYRRLGRTGLQVSCLGFGGAPMGLDNYLMPYDAATSGTQVVAALDRALDLGVNYIDTAVAYGEGLGERIIGEVLARRRADAYIATKVRSSLGHDDVLRSVEESRLRLGVDVIDVIQFHGGYLTAAGYRRLIDDGPLDALRRLRDDGKVRFIGITNEVPDHTLLWAVESGHFDVLQVRYNLFHQGPADPLIPEATKNDIGVVAMRPLASGLFRKLLQRIAPDVIDRVSPEQVALDFVLSDPGVATAICGMRTVAEVEQNVRFADEARFRWTHRLDRGQGGLQLEA